MRGGARLAVALLGVGMIAFAGTAPPATAQRGRMIVTITAHGPNPRIARALVGQEVVFRNGDARQRKIVSLENLFESGPLVGAEGSPKHGVAGSGEVSVIFDEPGLYGYLASGRPRQTGTIDVKDPPGVVRVPTATPTPRGRRPRR